MGFRSCIARGVVAALFALAGTVTASDAPSLRLAPMQASKLSWDGTMGRLPGDEKRMYLLVAREWFGLPGLSDGKPVPDTTAYTAVWLRAHPGAMAIPVESIPLTRDLATVYVWVVDGRASLNLDLVEQGYVQARTMAPILRAEDRFVGADRVEPFLRDAAAAERRAAAADRGLWKTASDGLRADAGRITRGSMVLSDLVAASEAEESYKPPPVYDAGTPEVDLIGIAAASDPGASFAALHELVQRAIGGRLSPGGFSSLIETGLNLQGRTDSKWRAYYGALIDVAYGQGRLTDAQVNRYARQSLVVRVHAQILDARLQPKGSGPTPVLFQLDGESRAGGFREIEGEPKSSLPLTSRVALTSVAIDGTPASMIHAGAETAAIVNRAYIGGGGAEGTNVQLVPRGELGPGEHVVTAKVAVEVRKGGVLTRRDGDDLAVPLTRRTMEVRAPFTVGH
jgi:hypothetical protein